MTADERHVICACSLGTTFEWYDFYIYGTLGVFLAKYFFSNVAPTAALIFTLLVFGAGFAVRPFGALLFGPIGDLVGRKYTFLVTMTLMGLGTFLIGVLPPYSTSALVAPIILVSLRLVQGLALGGEYGGAAIYVAEHAPAGKRGYYTSWIQSTATLGLFMALLVILGIRTWMGEDAFANWGRRLPFLFSTILLGISIWIRLRLQESPVFQHMKEQGWGSEAPLTEAFGRWENAKIAILALFGATAGQAVIWYGGQIYALFFLSEILKVSAASAQIMVAIALAIGMPFFILFGWLSDKIGRQPILLLGFFLAVAIYFPLFQSMTDFANPALETALAASPVVVIAAPAECDFQFNPVGTARFTSSCDIAKAALFNRSVNYRNEAAPPLMPAKVRVGEQLISTTAPDFGEVLRNAITAHGYPAGADTSQINKPMTVLLLTVLVIYVANGLRSDRSFAGGTVPNAHPLHGLVAAVPRWQWLVWWVPAGYVVCHYGRHWGYLFRALVSDRRGSNELHRRLHFSVRNERSRHRLLMAAVPNIVDRSFCGLSAEYTAMQSLRIHLP